MSATPNRHRLLLQQLRRRQPALFRNLVELAAGRSARIGDEDRSELIDAGVLNADGDMESRMKEIVLGVSDDE